MRAIGRSLVAYTEDRRLSLIILASGFVVLSVGSFWGLPAGRSVVGGFLILDGGAPYRDFWTMYAPGQFYAMAAVFWLFGRELLVQALAVCLIRAGSAVVFFTLLRRLGAPHRVAFCASAVFVLAFWTTGPELTEYPPALLCLLLALDRMVAYFSGSGTEHLRWAGLWIGLAVLFKHDVAAYMSMGIAIGVFVSWVLVGGRGIAAWQSPTRATLTIAVPALAVFTPVAAWTAWSAGADAWNDLFLFPATVFHRVRGDVFPSLVPDLGPVLIWLADLTNEAKALAAAETLTPWILLTVPQIVFVAGLLAVLAARRRFDAAGTAHASMFLACLPFFWAAAHVQHNTHPYTMAILTTGFAAVVYQRLRDVIQARKVLGGVLTAAVVVYVGGLLTPPVIRVALVAYEWNGSRVLDLPGLRGIRLPARLYDSFHPVGQFIRTHTRADEPIYAGLLRHDAIVINNTMLYVIAGRPPCCRYTELHPGVADREPIQREIIRRLEDSNVRAMVLWEFGWPRSVMERRKQHTMAAVSDAGSSVLDEYIARRFAVAARHGEYRVLWRRDLSPPVGDGVERQH
jgi:hypothetical protein